MLKFSRAWTSEYGGDRNCPLSFVLADKNYGPPQARSQQDLRREYQNITVVSVEHMGRSA